MISEAERAALAPYCSGCGKPGGEHAGCRRPLDPPHFCTRCGRKLAVQVLPTSVASKCVRCG